MWNTPKKFTKCYYIGKRGMAQLQHTRSYMMHCHPLANRTDLTEQLGAYSNLPQFITGNISLILQFNNLAPSIPSSRPLPL